MTRKLQQVPILGLDLVSPDGIAVRRPGVMRVLHNLRPVTVIDNRPVWRPMRSVGGTVSITGLEGNEELKYLWVYRTPYRSVFDDTTPPPERILAVSDRRVLLLEDASGNGVLSATTLYRYDNATNISAQATVLSGRVLLSIRIDDDWHTFQVVGKRLFELPIPFPSGVQITGTTSGGSLSGGLYAVRLAVRLWDGTPGPWSRPYAVLLPTTSTGKIEVDATGLEVPGGWEDAVHALRIGIAVVDPNATSLDDSAKRKLFAVDYYDVGEIAISPASDLKFSFTSADNITNYPLIDIANMTGHRVTSRTIYALNGRVWWGNIRQYFSDMPLSGVDVTASGGTPVVTIRPNPPGRGGVDRLPYAPGISLWWEPSSTPGCVYDVFRAEINSRSAATAIVTGYNQPGQRVIEYVDSGNLSSGVTYYYWVEAVHQATGGRSESFYLGSATW